MISIHFGKRLPKLGGAEDAVPDWVQANPKRIDRALTRALALPSGGWHVIGASRDVKSAPKKIVVSNRELVVFRGLDEKLVAGPVSCPHMGADLSCGRVEGNAVVCPWHGLRLSSPHGNWRPIPTFDDGVLSWVQLTAKDTERTARPILCERPKRFVDAVIQIDAKCEPRDVIANRLDPWHGAHYHPYSFANLTVTDDREDGLYLRVTKRIAGPLCTEVAVRFHCPEPRTIAMTILEGEGAGSVVETHATPISTADRPGGPKTAIIEATLATSSRLGFIAALAARDALRPFVANAARRLWVDDAAYAERLYSLRNSNP